MKVNITSANTSNSGASGASQPSPTTSPENAPPCVAMSMAQSARMVAVLAAQHMLETIGHEPGLEHTPHQSMAAQGAQGAIRMAASLPINRCIDIKGKLVTSIDLQRTAEQLSPKARFNSSNTDSGSSGLSKTIQG